MTDTSFRRVLQLDREHRSMSGCSYCDIFSGAAQGPRCQALGEHVDEVTAGVV